MESTCVKIFGGILQGRMGNKAGFIVYIEPLAEVLKCKELHPTVCRLYSNTGECNEKKTGIRYLNLGKHLEH